MRRTVAQGMELAGLGALTGGVFVVLGAGAALIVGGVLLTVAAFVVERGT